MPDLAISACPASARYGEAYVGQLEASGGSAPYTFSIAEGSALPTGLEMDSSGRITGTVSVVGIFATTYQVTDALAATATLACSMKVIPESSYIFGW